MDLAAVEWEKSLAEWRRTLPGDVEADKVAEVEKKLTQAKHHVAQKAQTTDAKP
jgi:hypothetical protein